MSAAISASGHEVIANELVYVPIEQNVEADALALEAAEEMIEEFEEHEDTIRVWTTLH